MAVVGVPDAAALARKIHADMTASTGRAYSVGVSQVGAGPLDIPRLYEEARVALQVGQRLAGRGAVTDFAGLGLYRLISHVSQAELRAFVHDTLGPVLDLPEPARSDLLKSLAVLSSTRFNVAESARILHYHYNTMRYRVTKLERMLGEFADDRRHPADRRRPGDPPHVRDLRRQRRHLVSQDRAAGMLAENRAHTTLPAWLGGVQPQVSASALMT